MSTIYNAMNVDVAAQLRRFLPPPTGTSPEAIKDRIMHWFAIAKHPEKHVESSNLHTIAAKRKAAKQNLRKLIVWYPQIAAEIDIDVSPMAPETATQEVA